MKKKWLGCTIAVVLLVIAIISIAFSDTPLKIIVNGKELIPDVPPKIINGTVMVPVTWLAQTLGADVKWDEQNRTVTITKEARADNTLPAVFRNIADKFQGMEIPVYLPAYLPTKDTLALAKFSTSKNSYSFVIIRRDKTSISLSDEVVAVAASDKPFSPNPTEEQLFAVPPVNIEVNGIQVKSFKDGTAVKWSQDNWELAAVGHGPQEGVRIAAEMMPALPQGTDLVPGSLEGTLRVSQLGNPMYVTASWTYDGKTWYTLDGRSSVEDMVKMLQSVTRLTRDESGQRRYYPRVPDKITTPEMALQAYFDALSVAANLTFEQMNAAGGTVGMGLEPYPTAYGYWSKKWQDKNSYSEFLSSWEGTANVELLKLLPAGEEGGQKRFFVETRHLEVAEDPPRVGQFYYAGFFTVSETAEGWRITGGELEPQSLGWKLGGHQPWRADPETVALLELGASLEAPLGEAVTEYNTDGTAAVRFIDSEGNVTHMAVLVQREDGIWQVLYTQKLNQADLKNVLTDEYIVEKAQNTFKDNKNDTLTDVRVEVLLYHELAPGGSEEWPVIDPQDFYTQINLLLDHGWQPLTLDKFAAWLRGEEIVEGKSFLLTFDDGGESIYRYAYPFLLEKGIPATIFLIGKYHDPNYHINEIIWVPKLADKQIKEMAGSGLIQFQSHSYNLHREIEEKPAAIVLPPPDVLEDFRKSAKVLEELTGQQVFSIAYPSGEINQQVIELAAEAGFKLGFAGNIQGPVNKTQPMSIKRYPLDNIPLNVFMDYYGIKEQDNFRQNRVGQSRNTS